ncbi:hypothetical protein HDU87_008086 [Geranomyces variabilis]|uniref:Uncharacterized protein n=1 Tax=Geranomyces variabilis TaxID=109894 RepID=A0AAD5TRF5_9FUNG|nr:hypothetical protein HDU87_008086 [Geranomyces variabilis]
MTKPHPQSTHISRSPIYLPNSIIEDIACFVAADPESSRDGHAPLARILPLASVCRQWYLRARSVRTVAVAIIANSPWAFEHLDYVTRLLLKPAVGAKGVDEYGFSLFGTPPFVTSVLYKMLILSDEQGLRHYLSEEWLPDILYRVRNLGLGRPDEPESSAVARLGFYEGVFDVAQPYMSLTDRLKTVKDQVVYDRVAARYFICEMGPESVPPRLLGWLAEVGDLDLMTLMMDQCEVPAGATDNFALNRACEAGQIEAARLLLSRGASPVNADGGRGYALPLSAAAARENMAIVDLLLEHGADINEEDSQALRYAIFGIRLTTCTPNVIGDLLTRGARPEIDPLPLFLVAVESSNAVNIDKLFSHPRSVDWVSAETATIALIAAAAHNNLPAVAYLLALPAPNQPKTNMSYTVPYTIPEENLTSPLAASLSRLRYRQATAAGHEQQQQQQLNSGNEFAIVDLLIARGADAAAHDNLVWKDLLIRPLADPVHANVIQQADGLTARRQAFLTQGVFEMWDWTGRRRLDDDDDDDEDEDEDEENESESNDSNLDGGDNSSDDDEGDIKSEAEAEARDDEKDVACADASAAGMPPRGTTDVNFAYWDARIRAYAHLVVRHKLRAPTDMMEKVRAHSGKLYDRLLEAEASITVPDTEA